MPHGFLSTEILSDGILNGAPPEEEPPSWTARMTAITMVDAIKQASPIQPKKNAHPETTMRVKFLGDQFVV